MGSLIAKLMIVFLIAFIAFTFFACELVAYNLQDVWLNLILFLALMFSLYRNKFNILNYFFGKGNLWFWLYLILISLNIYFAHDPLLAFNSYKKLCVSAVLIYFLFKNETKEGNINILLYGICICAAIAAAFGLGEMLFKANPIYKYLISNFYYERFIGNRMMSTFLHPNILGGCIIAVVPLAYYFYKDDSFKKFRPLSLAFLLLAITAVFLTYSRGSWLALLSLISLWLIFRRKFKAVSLVWMGFFLFSLISNFPFIAESVRNRLGITNLYYYLRYGHRSMQYLVTANILKIHPLIGIGFGHYRQLFNLYSPVKLDYEVMIPDSVYLMHLAETGIIGFFGFAGFVGAMLRRAFISYKKTDGAYKSMSLTVMFGFAAILFNMASYDGFLWKGPFYLFWMFAGIIASFQAVSSGCA